MASITKRQNKWQVRIRLSNYPTITKTFNLKSHAMAWAKLKEIQIENGNLEIDSKPTIELPLKLIEVCLNFPKRRNPPFGGFQ